MDHEKLAAAGVRYHEDGPVATITLDRPEVRNAQTPAMWRALAGIGRDLPPEVRVVVLRGSGHSFSAGLDRAMLDPAAGRGSSGPGAEESVAGLLALSDEQMVATIQEYQEGFTFLRDPRFVSIAAVQGYAIGAGFQLTLACDLRIAAADARFSMKEAALGLVPDLTGTKPLVEAVGYARALEMCVTTRFVEAAEAERIGLVQEVVAAERLDERVAEVAAALSEPLPEVVTAIKGLLEQAPEMTLGEQAERERRAQVERMRHLARLAQE